MTAEDIALTLLTRFTAARAVDLWDGRFRWRSGARLHDRTIEATWQRVAATIAAPEGDSADYWCSRYAFAFSRWQILPDPALLRFAGTDRPVPVLPEPCAVVNAGAFVTDPDTPRARFDHKRFTAAAAVAVRMLDDAAMVFGAHDGRPLRLAVGLMGLGDVLEYLRLGYDCGRAPAVAQAIARSLALGCLQAALQLAQERGGRGGGAEAGLAERWKHRALPAALAEATERCRRYEGLTRIQMQPELACLANDASDALEPSMASAIAIAGAAPALQAARRRIRNMVQPWIDAPVSSGQGVLDEMMSEA
ncbi:hypothetical protein [Lysobacter gummosus]|uniref:Ribonucleotide reductase large subunit C-terminal domain-containing protein n=1 Tax=Lysobacter gummosus TaxID=262324 RepID=A0ABY3XJ44_9GAMM|nr:hypothetical protein [Lysobacter gummosus]ALN91248.1 ribonucleotide reductase, barrel domain protein [Lysobacter gummosus]UNP31651.1 hypothetical protein MOV92_10555 [Lysobacter gummosus]